MSKWKQRMIGFAAGAVFFSGASYAASVATIQVDFAPLTYFFDGVEKQPPADQQGFIYNGRTYVPLRFMGEALGKQVGYDATTMSIYVGKQTWADNVTFTKKTFAAENPTQKVTYVEIDGLPVPEVEGHLNLILKDTAMIEDTQEVVGYAADTKVQVRKGKIANLIVDSDVFTGGAHGMPSKVSLVLDLENGARYELADLFKEGSDYVGRISRLIKEQDREKILESFGPFERIEENQGFYLTETGLTVFFEPYVYTPYALGFPEFTIPWEKVADLVDKEGFFWKRLNE